MGKSRPTWPGHATVQEAVQYLASVCDGAIKRDGHGFRSDHVAYGHWLARLPASQWGPEEVGHGRTIVRTYRQQLQSAGFNPEQIISGKRPRRIRRKRAAMIRSGWAPDPTGLAGQRWWNGARWTASVCQLRRSDDLGICRPSTEPVTLSTSS